MAWVHWQIIEGYFSPRANGDPHTDKELNGANNHVCLEMNPPQVENKLKL